MSRKTSDNPDNIYNNDLVAEIGKYYKRGDLAPKITFHFSVDPLAEKYSGGSPYNYTLLNPVKLIDPDGRNGEERGDWIYHKKTGKYDWDGAITSSSKLSMIMNMLISL